MAEARRRRGAAGWFRAPLSRCPCNSCTSCPMLSDAKQAAGEAAGALYLWNKFTAPPRAPGSSLPRAQTAFPIQSYFAVPWRSASARHSQLGLFCLYESLPPLTAFYHATGTLKCVHAEQILHQRARHVRRSGSSFRLPSLQQPQLEVTWGKRTLPSPLFAPVLCPVASDGARDPKGGRFMGIPQIGALRMEKKKIKKKR